MCPIYDKFSASGVPTNLAVYDSVMVEYEEPGETVGLPGYVYADEEKLDFRG